MPYAVELYFDPAAEARLYHAWAGLAVEGISAVTHEGPYRPHVSLLITTAADVPAFDAGLAAVASRMSPLTLTLSSIGVFPASDAVVFLGVVVTDELLRAHAAVLDLGQRTAGGLWQHYLPGQWVPHCTMAYRVPTPRVPEVVRLCMQLPLPVTAGVTAVGLVEFYDEGAREISTHPWGQRAGEG